MLIQFAQIEYRDEPCGLSTCRAAKRHQNGTLQRLLICTRPLHLVARLIFVLIFGLLLNLPQQAQAQAPVLAWQHTYGTAFSETGGFSVPVPGGYLLLGTQSDIFFGYGVLYFVRIDMQGDTLWTKRVPVATVIPGVTGFLRDTAGNLVVTGGYGDKAFVLKFNSSCMLIWSRIRQFPNPNIVVTHASYSSPYIAPDGNYIMLEYNHLFYRIGDSQSYALLKIDQNTGTDVWSTSLQNVIPSNFLGQNLLALMQTSNGYIINLRVVNWTGYPNNLFTNYNGQLMLNSAGGFVRFRTSVVSTSTNSDPIATATYRATDGNNVTAGRETLTKINAAGDTLWHTVVPSRYPNQQWYGSCVTQDGQGNYIVAGSSSFYINANNAGTNIHLARFRPNGQLANDTMIYRPGFALTYAVMPTSNGDLLISGYTSSTYQGDSDLLAFQFQGFRPLAAQAVNAPMNLAVYPNPNRGAVEVRVLHPATTGSGQLTLLDCLGLQVLQQFVQPDAYETTLSLAGVAPGLYVLRLTNAAGQSWTTKMVRE